MAPSPLGATARTRPSSGGQGPCRSTARRSRPPRPLTGGSGPRSRVREPRGPLGPAAGGRPSETVRRSSLTRALRLPRPAGSARPASAAPGEQMSG